jgi:hypothetical protein
MADDQVVTVVLGGIALITVGRAIFLTRRALRPEPDVARRVRR